MVSLRGSIGPTVLVPNWRQRRVCQLYRGRFRWDGCGPRLGYLRQAELGYWLRLGYLRHHSLHCVLRAARQRERADALAIETEVLGKRLRYEQRQTGLRCHVACWMLCIAMPPWPADSPKAFRASVTHFVQRGGFATPSVQVLEMKIRQLHVASHLARSPTRHLTPDM